MGVKQAKVVWMLNGYIQQVDWLGVYEDGRLALMWLWTVDDLQLESSTNGDTELVYGFKGSDDTSFVISRQDAERLGLPLDSP